MSRVDFYHLQNSRLEDVLPKLLEKAYAANKNIVVKIGNEERIDFLNSILWSYSETSFLPHGSKKDGFAELQPIWLTNNDDTPNKAEFIFLVDGANINVGKVVEFERVIYIFDGEIEENLASSREFWKELKNSSIDTFYWQQVNGSWQQKG